MRAFCADKWNVSGNLIAQNRHTGQQPQPQPEPQCEKQSEKTEQPEAFGVYGGSGQWAEARRIELAKGRIQLNTQPGNDAKITKRLQHFVCAALSLVFILCRVRFLSVCGTDCLWHSKVQTAWTTVATMFRPVRLPISPTSTPPPLPTLPALLPSLDVGIFDLPPFFFYFL